MTKEKKSAETLQFLSGEINLLHELQPLWEELNEHHQRLSPHFAEEMARRTFAERCQFWLDEANNGQIKVDLVQDNHSPVAYCVTTLNQQLEGEISSLFIKESYRRDGIGDALMRRALAWLDSLGAKTRTIGVATGNEGAFAFCQRYGFYPRMTKLVQKESE